MGIGLTLTLAGLALWALGSLIGVWLLYYAVKCAIRDGINESALASRGSRNWSATVRDAQQRGTLPDMRAD